MQQRTYVTITPKVHDIGNIRGWILVFLSRDDPFKVKHLVAEEMSEADKKRHMTQKILPWVGTHRQVLKAKQVKDVVPIYENRLCKSRADHDKMFAFEPCPFKGVCVNVNKEKTFAYIKDSMSESDHSLPVLEHLPSSVRKIRNV